MFRFIFGKVYGTEIPVLSVQLSSIPKEITCKGALKVGVGESITGNTIRFWMGGTGDGIWGTALDKEKEILKTPKYGDIDDRAMEMIEKTILDFYALLDEYTGGVNLEGAFNIELQAYWIFRHMRGENIREYLMRGLKAFFKKNEKHAEETLFFYPLIGILNKLSFELSETGD